MIFDNNYKTIFNYFISFLGSILFLLVANYLNLQNIEKYILILSLSTIFGSVIYSSAIKSKIQNENICINFTSNAITVLIIIFIIVLVYLFIKENYFIVFFFLITILYEICFNLFSTYFIKHNKSFNHSKFLLIVSITKNLFLFLFLINNDLLKIILIYYFLFILFFIFQFKKLKFFFKSSSRPFKIIDLLYIFIGSLVFQIDKILGESLLLKENYITYYLIFKFASTFQIIGSLITQPLRNNMISLEKITKKIIKNLNKIILILILLLTCSNAFFILLSNVDIFSLHVFHINLENLIIFNLLSLSIIAHVYNGFYLDALFINDYGKINFGISLLVLIFEISILFFYKSLIVWSLGMLIGQLILLIFSKFIYLKKC
tara:strand:+ start:134 stop:1261 length:1128 start_codon:yes stop_codon:yes gene_type:complete